MKILLCMLLLITMNAHLFAQNYSGAYQYQTAGGVAKLTLTSVDSVLYSGSLRVADTEFEMEGRVVLGLLKGTVGRQPDMNFFEAQFNGTSLFLTIMEQDAGGSPDAYTAQVYQFDRMQANTQTFSTPDAVIINGSTLTDDQVQALEQRYGVKPVPGNYWYDAVSGLYGATGYAAFGFMYPGHDLGLLKQNASAGNTGVMINGRELPADEWAVWSYILGYFIQPGSYWLDEQGNAGYTGYDIPLVNLFVAAQQSGYNGKGSGGDNFWSTRFSAGNSNADNSQGYVSVPGYGPVGYGF